MAEADDFVEAFLEHRGKYDPVKAREYYLRTRKLKGRSTARSESNDISREKSIARASRARKMQRLARDKSDRQELDRRRKTLSSKKRAASLKLEATMDKAMPIEQTMKRIQAQLEGMTPGPERTRLEAKLKPVEDKFWNILDKISRKIQTEGLSEFYGL